LANLKKLIGMQSEMKVSSKMFLKVMTDIEKYWAQFADED